MHTAEFSRCERFAEDTTTTQEIRSRYQTIVVYMPRRPNNKTSKKKERQKDRVRERKNKQKKSKKHNSCCWKLLLLPSWKTREPTVSSLFFSAAHFASFHISPLPPFRTPISASLLHSAQTTNLDRQPHKLCLTLSCSLSPANHRGWPSSMRWWRAETPCCASTQIPRVTFQQ